MKRKISSFVLFFAILFGVFCFSSANAQQKETTSEQIAKKLAPFVNESTVVAGYLNLDAIDLYELACRSIDYLDQIMEIIGFDEESFQATRTELKNALELKKQDIEKPLKQFKEETGLKEIYVTVNLANQVYPAIFIAPIKGISEKQKEKIREYLSKLNDSITVYSTNDFLYAGIATPAYLLEEEQDLGNLMEKYVKEFQPAPVPFIKEALALREGDPIRVVAIVPKDAAKLIKRFADNLDDESTIDIQSARVPLNLMSYASTKLLWGVWGVNLKKLDAQLILKAKNTSAARDIMRALEGSLNYFSMIMGFVSSFTGEDERLKDAIPLAAEILKAHARSHFPRQEKDFLIWESDFSPEALKKMNFLRGAPAGVMVALMLPAVQAAREAARRMQCSNNEKFIMLSLHNYHDAQRTLPPIFTADEDGKVLHSWRVLILPYIGEPELYDQIRLDEPWDSAHNKQFHEQCPAVFRCPSANIGSEQKTCCYSVIMGEETAFFDETPKNFAKITDGTSNTVCIVERKEPINWMDPLNEITFEEALEGINGPKAKIGSWHTGGINVALFDGSVRFISSTIDKDTWKALLTIAGGEAGL